MISKKKKKKKRSSPKFRAIFLPISQVQTFEGGLFSYGGGYFPFFTENRPQNHKKHAILHTSQANGGGSSPPAPPGYATDWIGFRLSEVESSRTSLASRTDFEVLGLEGQVLSLGLKASKIGLSSARGQHYFLNC